MGDVILTTPLIKLLKINNPKLKIDFLVSDKFKEIIINNPYINKIIEYDKSLNFFQQFTFKIDYFKTSGIKKYDIIIDLQNNLRSIQFRSGKYKQLLTFDKRRDLKKGLTTGKIQKTTSYDLIPDLYIKTAGNLISHYNENKLELWLPEEKENLLYLSAKPVTHENIIGIAPGAHHFTKRFPPDKFIEVINNFPDYKFMIVGSKAEKEICDYIAKNSKVDTINAYEGNSIIETARNLDKCLLLITNDTGVMHIAAARQVPVVAIFGSTVPQLGFAPYKVKNRIIETNLECRPCTHIGRSQCPLNHFNCMNNIKNKDIVEAVNHFLHNS